MEKDKELERINSRLDDIEQILRGLDSVSPSVFLEMFRSISNQVIISNRITIEAWEDIKSYRSQREQEEQQKQLSTEEKINKEIDKRSSIWIYFRDRVLPGLWLAVFIAILKFLGFI